MRSIPSQAPALVDHGHARVNPNSVDTAGIQDGAVTSAKILDGTITTADLNSAVYATVGTITAIDPDDAASAGVSATVARGDHQHDATAAVASALTKTATSTEGSSGDIARADHGHSTSALPWGIVARQVLTGNSTTWTTDATTDHALSSVAVDAARLYKVCLHTPNVISAAGRWLINFHVGGTLTDRFFDLGNLGGTFDWTIDASILWTPSTGTHNIDVRVDEISGTGDLTFVGSATAQRWFWVEDIGLR